MPAVQAGSTVFCCWSQIITDLICPRFDAHRSERHSLFSQAVAPWKRRGEQWDHAHICDLFFFSVLGPSNHHSQSTLRPPLPPPHNHSLSHHHSSANSLNRNSLTNRRNQIHAPAPAPNDLATTPESVQLQDSWVLNSNVPLETRWVPASLGMLLMLLQRAQRSPLVCWEMGGGVLCAMSGFSSWGWRGVRTSSSPNLLCTGRYTVNNAAHILF